MPLLHLTRSNTRFPRLYTSAALCARHLHNSSASRITARNALGRQTLPPQLLLAKRATFSPPSIPALPLITMGHTHKRQHAGHAHGHGHGHSHDNAYLTSSNRNDAGVKITRIGLFVNLAMAIGKGFGGYIFHSQALIADGFHALTDLVSDFMTLATISWSLRPPSNRFPMGYGKIESLGALGVSGLLLFGGIGMGLNGLDTLYTQFVVDHAHDAHEHSHGLFSFLGHNHSHGTDIPNLNAAWLAAGSIVVKEWLYRASEYRTSPCRMHTDTSQP